MKKSISESNALYKAHRPAPITIPNREQTGGLRNRSDSSPNILQPQKEKHAARNYDGDTEEYKWRSDARRGQSPSRGRSVRSPAKHLDDVPEKDESFKEQPFTPPKRSKSPIKRMFGEGGWLSTSSGPKEESSAQKRSRLMGKIKSKIEELVSDNLRRPQRDCANQNQ
jgi:hypothetical protein